MLIYPLVLIPQRDQQEFIQNLESDWTWIVWQGVFGSEERLKKIVRNEGAQERKHFESQSNRPHTRRTRDPPKSLKQSFPCAHALRFSNLIQTIYGHGLFKWW